MRQFRARALHWLAPFCLVLAFHQFQQQVVSALQQQASEQHVAQDQTNSANINLNLAPQISMGSESSSALESSAALAQDDLIAAESNQSPDALLSSEHKTFTNAQVVRQDGPQQQAASVAPVFAQVQPQQQPQPQQQVQQAQQQVQVQQQQQQPAPGQQLFGVHPQHMLQARIQHQQPKQFNPFMAAALAGNYGPAQQQIAAAAAAGMHQAQHPAHQHVAHQPQQHGPQPHHFPLQQVHQLAHAAQQHQLVAPHHHARQVAMAPEQPVAQPQQQQVLQQVPQPQQQVAPAQHQQALAVQESTVRQNIVPAPAFSGMDSNSIELNDSPHQAQAQPLAAASSVAHPQVLSAASSGSSLDVSGGAQAWPLQAPDIPKIVNLEVKCEKNLMKVSIEFDKVFNGVIFSKGHYNQGQCLHVGQNSGKQQAYFDISINSCGTQGNTQNGLYGMGGNTGSGTYFENTIVVQYDPNVQEVYDHARKLRCTWHDQYEKAVTFRPFPVDMLDIVRADFAGDNVGCWMQIQVGKGPWASEVAGIVKIGQTMTMVLAIKDEENKFDMLVRNCFAHDGKRGPIELVDKSGCITRPKLMSRFTKIKNFGSSATVLSYAHFQAFKFPDSMEVHFQCTIQICRHQCPEQCSAGPGSAGAGGEAYSESTISGTFNIHANQAAQQAAGGAGALAGPDQSGQHLRKFGSSALSRERRDLGEHAHHNWLASNGSQRHHHGHFQVKPMTQTVGLNRIIQVVSTGDLAFNLPSAQQQQFQQVVINGTTDEIAAAAAAASSSYQADAQICMSSYQFVMATVLLLLILLCSCLVAVSLYLRQRSLAKRSSKLLVPHSAATSGQSSTCSSPMSTMRSNQHQHHLHQHHHQQPSSVPSNQQQHYTTNHHHLHHQQPVLSMFDASKMH